MTPPERMAKDLMQFQKYPFTPKAVDWEALAKHVQKLILQGMIDELTVLLLDLEMDMGLDKIIRNRIAELQKQLTEV